jgi:hypothetical protein
VGFRIVMMDFRGSMVGLSNLKRYHEILEIVSVLLSS